VLFAISVASGEASAAVPDKVPDLSDVREFLGPLWTVISFPAWLLTFFAWVVARYPSAAVLVSAASAGTFAWLAMRHQSKVARTRETFATVNRDNWDEDVIKARRVFGRISNQLKDQPGALSRYAGTVAFADGRQAPSGSDAEKEHIETRVTLLTILNDYENQALAIKHGILDETYLFNAIRSTALRDWETLSPFVQELRTQRRNPQAYIEFEGLVAQWSKDCSFTTGRPLTKSSRQVRVK
jgi:hypothetical protein